MLLHFTRFVQTQQLSRRISKHAESSTISVTFILGHKFLLPTSRIRQHCISWSLVTEDVIYDISAGSLNRTEGVGGTVRPTVNRKAFSRAGQEHHGEGDPCICVICTGLQRTPGVLRQIARPLQAMIKRTAEQDSNLTEKETQAFVLCVHGYREHQGRAGVLNRHFPPINDVCSLTQQL